MGECFFCLKPTKSKMICLCCKSMNKPLGKNYHFFCGDCLENHIKFHNLTQTNTICGVSNMTTIEKGQLELSGNFCELF